MYLNAKSILLCGAHSPAWGYLAPPYSIVVITSLGEEFSRAFTNTSTGFFFVFCSIIRNAFLTMFATCMLFPVQWPELTLCSFPLWPGIISLFINLSIIGVLFLWNRMSVCLPQLFR